MNEQDLVYRLRERARIRRQIPGRKSVQENKPDRIADLLEEAADEIDRRRKIDADCAMYNAKRNGIDIFVCHPGESCCNFQDTQSNNERRANRP